MEGLQTGSLGLTVMLSKLFPSTQLCRCLSYGTTLTVTVTQRMRRVAVKMPRWPKEVKPRHNDMMINLSVLMNAAEELGELVFFFTNDASNFFNQIKLAHSEFSRC